MRPVHAPYASGKGAFAIGLAPLDLDDWIEVDEQLSSYLAEKHRLLDHDAGDVWNAEPETREAQLEVRDALVGHIAACHGQTHIVTGHDVVLLDSGDAIALHRDDPAPLKTASLMMQEDLCLMRRGGEGWRLAAGSVCFASSWSFRKKFGQTLDGLHAPVPGYQEKLAVRMARIFDNLRVEQPVWRRNWSLYDDGALHHPESPGAMAFGVEDRENASAWADAVHIRVERQTLRKMPVSGDILFTIRIHIDRLSALLTHPDRARLTAAMRTELLAFDDGENDYKGLRQDRGHIAAALAKIAAS